MLASDDPRWSTLTGGYKMPLDPRPLIKRLLEEPDTTDAWSELWDELHHQGDVGEASYAAVPLLVEAHRRKGGDEWNTYAIVSIIDLARTEPNNPRLPEWLSADYFAALEELSRLGAQELRSAEGPDTIRAILSVLALSKGLRLHAKLLILYTEDEIRELTAKL